MFSRDFTIFVVIGGFAALVNFFSRILYNQFVVYEIAVIIAYITGMLVAYVMSRKYVFGPSKRSKKSELYRFSIINLLAVIQVWIISVVLARYVFPALGFGFYPYEVAHIIGLGIPVFTSYIGHKYYSFK